MSKIDLATLPTAELRQLLDSARQRGQAAQSYEILREMDARRSGLAAPIMTKGRRRPARRGPRMIELQLGDPLEKFDEPLEGSPDVPDAEPPLTLGEPAAPQAAPPVPPASVRPRWGHWATLCFALGLGGGVAAGWWAADGGSWQPMARPIRVAARAPTPRPPLPVVISTPAAPAAPAPPEPAVAETQLASATGAAAPPATAAPAPAEPSPEVAAPPTPRSSIIEAHAVVPRAKDPPVETAASDDKACSGEPTPADAVICREPRLRRLQAELRSAYAEALAAHQDRALLRQRQLAWRDGRNAVSSPDQLARLYSKRIGQLKAATAEAIRER